MPTKRNWHTPPTAAPRQRLIHTNPRSAAPATSPNSAAPLDTPHSALDAGANTPQPATLERKHPVDARQQLCPKYRAGYPARVITDATNLVSRFSIPVLLTGTPRILSPTT